MIITHLVHFGFFSGASDYVPTAPEIYAATVTVCRAVLDTPLILRTSTADSSILQVSTQDIIVRTTISESPSITRVISSDVSR